MATAANRPAVCPSCGGALQLLRLNMRESMLSCAGGGDCLWPLDSDEGASDVHIVADARAPAELAEGRGQHRRKKKKRRRESQAPAAAQPPAAQRGRASPAASPIRSPEFAAGFAPGGAAAAAPAQDGGSMQPMMDAESLKRGGAEKKPAAEQQPSAPASETFGALSPGLSGSQGSKSGPGGAQGIDLQAQLNALDAFLQGDDDDDDDLL